MIDFSSKDGYFPVIPASGNGSVAGIYAPTAGRNVALFVTDVLFLCPAKGSAVVVRIPRMQDIIAAQGPKLVTFHRRWGVTTLIRLGLSIKAG